MSYKIFVINTGSTSTKLALFEGGQETWSADVTHQAAELKNIRRFSTNSPIGKRPLTRRFKKTASTSRV